LLGKKGSTLKQLENLTSCKIIIQQHPALSYAQSKQALSFDQPLAIKLNGGKKQRRLAYDAIQLIADCGSMVDVNAGVQGAVVVPHEVVDKDQSAWLAWRLFSIEQEHDVRAEVSGQTIRLWPVSEAKPISHEVRAAAEAAVDAAHNLTELRVDGKPDLVDKVVGSLATGEIAEHYGVVVRALKPEGDDVVPVRIVGPQQPANDLAATLWARFSQGRATAEVLHGGEVESLAKLAAAEFARDLRELEAECKVEVTNGECSYGIAGESADAVAEAKAMLCDMLLFYLPNNFLLYKDLPVDVVDRLRTVPKLRGGLRAIASKPGCAVSIDGTKRTAWVCGKSCRDDWLRLLREAEANLRLMT